MAAEHPPSAPASRRPRLSDRALTGLVATLLLVLLATLVAGWLTLRSPGLEPVSIPSLSQA
ncbi:hypothetical protein SAMN04488543_0991 [Friedmanniella luteola]|uniref:Uncharacterized protein n=1 Tax=Friedmanniella luteola TaxID=546871 RepID=A0A1H1P481_9ACTN|nr:hypothetical protein [Friedmanniella luteola]SDS05997.1 hypothetical protein SAMN04488543_0991 [Friedmanniella luteola]